MAKIRHFMLDINYNTDTRKYSFESQGVPHCPASVVTGVLTTIAKQIEKEGCKTMHDYYNPKAK